MKILLFLLPLLLSSCANYMNSLYNELDQNQPNVRKNSSNNFDLYRKKSAPTLSTSSQNKLLPAIERDYQPENQAKKRYKAKDLVDDQNDGSLWSGKNGHNYLFSNQKTRRAGDIILINILDKFKNEITQELHRSFPAPTSMVKGKAGATPTTPAPPAAPANQENAKGAIVHDRISAIIIEEINKDHLLIKGRKNLLFRNKKRVIEIQALVSKRDISDDDSISSNNFLESTINILR